jgi:hypothetical protein
MAKFDVRYVHKVSQSCRCGHPQYAHRRPRVEADGPAYLGDVKRDSPVWGAGACSAARCAPTPVGDCDGSTPCLEYVPKSEVLEINVADLAPTDIEAIVARVLKISWPVNLVRREPDGRIVAFFEKSTYHSIIITPVPE